MKITRSELRAVIKEELERELLSESSKVNSIATKLFSKVPWEDIISDPRVIKFIMTKGKQLIIKYLNSINMPDRSLSVWASVLYQMHDRGALAGAFNRGFKHRAKEELTDQTSNAKIAIGAPAGIHAVAKKIADNLEFYS